MRINLKQKQALNPFNIFILVLSIYVIMSLLVNAFVKLPVEVSRLLNKIDYGICAIFFIDFLVRFFRAESKLRYMRWGWIDLISSIPVFDFFVAGRMLRIVQVLRILRAFRSVRLLMTYFFSNKVKGTFTSVGIIAILMIIFSSIIILGLEKNAPGANIKTAEDALWWSYVTITTVGYGDHYPVTSMGRLVAAALMTVGVGLFGTFTAYVASWFVEKNEEKEEQEEKEIAEKEAAKKKSSIKKDMNVKADV